MEDEVIDVKEEILAGPAPDETANDDEKALLVKYLHAKENVKRLTAELKAATNIMDSAESNLMSLLEDDQKKATARYEGIGYVTIQEGATYASIEKGRADDVMRQVREMGRDDMIKTSIASSTLSSYVRDCLKMNMPIPDGVSFYRPKFLKTYLNKS